MREADFLFAIAEVGIALAGFATIVVAFSQRFRDQQAVVASTRLDSMLRCSLLGVFGALVPYIPHQSGLTQLAVWRISFLVLGLGWLAYFIYRMRAERPAGGVRMLPWTNRIAMFFVHPVGIVLSALGALGLLGVYSGPIFLGLLFALLAVSANLFLQLVSDLLGSPTV